MQLFWGEKALGNSAVKQQQQQQQAGTVVVKIGQVHSVLHTVRQWAYSFPSCCLKEANPNCLLQDFSGFMFMSLSHVIILYHKLPTLLYSREDPLLQCFSPLFSFSFLFFFFLKEKKLCNVCLCLHHAETTLTSK